MLWYTSACSRSTKYMIEAKVIARCAKGESVFISRMPMTPSDLFQFKRIQFSVEMCFSTTINKS